MAPSAMQLMPHPDVAGDENSLLSAASRNLWPASASYYWGIARDCATPSTSFVHRRLLI